MKKLFFLVFFFLTSPALAEHDVHTSGDYLSYCKESIKIYKGVSADESASNSCLSFVEGSIGMHAVFNTTGQGKPFYCLPESGTPTFEAVKIWVKYLENNPSKLNNSPLITFILAMREEYPCP